MMLASEGTAEQHIKEGKNAIRWTRLSCHAFRHNAVRLQLHALAYNLANFLRTLVSHARSTIFQMAEVAVPRDLFRRILEMIGDLRPRPVAPC